MKPICLSMTAFGAYADFQKVDFTELGDRSFFLIHGPTGAGKTTLLDAICFALYGETSGNERAAEQMRSHHNRSALLTEVIFDFALGAERYRIQRRPKQVRPKRRGTGTVTENAEATLWRRTGCSDSEEGETLASGWKAATAAIEELFGFDSKQFRQVIMLPQDQFRQLLKATSLEREALFRTLFQTELYEKVEVALKDAARALAAEITELRAQHNSILTLASVANAAELDAQAAGLAAEQQRRDEELKALKLDEATARQNRVEAEAIEQRFVELNEAEKKLNELLRRQGDMEQARQALEAARRALVLVEVEDALLKMQASARRLEEQGNDARTRWEADSKARDAAAAVLEREKNRQPELETARKRRDELQGMVKLANDLADARGRLKAAESGVAAAQRRVDAIGVQLKEQAQALSELEGRLSSAEAMPDESAELQAAEKDLKQAHAARKNLDEVLSQLDKDERRLLELEEGVNKAMAVRQLAREADQELNAAWRAGHAAVLAQRLVAGQPCPVCGATHHPHPAQPGPDLPSEGALQLSLEGVQKAEDALATAQEALAAHKATLREARTRVEMLEAQLGPHVSLSQAEIQVELTRIAGRQREAAKRKKQMAEWKQEIERLRNLRPGLEEERNSAENALRLALTDLTTAKTQVSERSEGLPPNLQTVDAVTQAAKSTAEMVDTLEAAYRAAVDAAQAAEQRAATSLARWKALDEQASDARRKATEEAEAFLQRLHESDFETEASYQSARRSPAEITRLEREISEYDAALQSARDRQRRATDSIAGLTRPDLEAIKAAEAEAAAKVAEATTQATRVAMKLEQVQRWAADLRAKAAELEALDARYSVLGRVAEVANGANGMKLSFHRFVLGALLDDVLLQASRRLQAMSNGRYLLQRRLEPASLRRAFGLDLDVTDTWTGETTRPVETLSGGEGFMAALALALGLADTVQAYAGGIRMDTIFIDEGFGSLDANALDRAIETLLTLNASGRLVGIISHVESLTERISTRLEVTAGQQGSTARFVIN